MSPPSQDKQQLLPENHPLSDLPSFTPSKISDTTAIEEPPNAYPQGRSRRRFWKQALVLMLLPLSVTAYFFWIWLYVLNREIDELFIGPPVIYCFVNYSWFLVGVFGLGWSKYGLVVLEAAMIEKPFWEPPNAAALLLHSDNSWSGPGGWIRGIQTLRKGREFVTHRPWLLLAILSILPVASLSISGLCLELSDGYYPSSTPASVIGRQWNNFNLKPPRSWGETYATTGWNMVRPGPYQEWVSFIHRKTFSVARSAA